MTSSISATAVEQQKFIEEEEEIPYENVS